MSKIIVTIDAEGNLTTEVQGVTGSGCETLLNALTAELGETTEDNTKPEYWDEAAVEFDYA